MGKTKQYYTIEEATQMLGVNRMTLMLLLDTIRPGVDPNKTHKIRTSELERIYGIIKASSGKR